MARKKYIYILIGAVIFIAIIGISLYFIRLNNFQATTSEIIPSIDMGGRPLITSRSEIEGRETYHNTKYGYEIKYPPGWTVWNSAGGHRQITTGYEWALEIGTKERWADPSGPRYGSVGINVKKGGDFCDINIDDGYINCDKPSPILTQTEIELAGEKAVLFRTEYSRNCIDNYVRIERDGYVYWISASCQWEEGGEPNKLFTDILSTLKFISPPLEDITLEWPIYRNANYGYEIKYPFDWEISAADLNKHAGLVTGIDSRLSLKAIGFDNSTIDISVSSVGEKEAFILNGLDNPPKTWDDLFLHDVSKIRIIKGSRMGEDTTWNIFTINRIKISEIMSVIYTAITAQDCWDQFIRVPYGDYIYWFHVYCEENSNRPLELIPEILSTFKFISG